MTYAANVGRLIHTEEVMGTVVSFDLRPGNLNRPAARAALAAACASLHDADAMFSTWKPASPMSRLRRGEIEPVEAPARLLEVLNLCEHARELSGGWFDPWALPGGVDPSGLVKGWAAQQAAQLLQARGISAGAVNAAGDIACFGRPESSLPWRFGVVDAADPARLARSFAVSGGIATSGTYERGEHVVDPFSGHPRARVASATVIGPDLALADALATALLAEGGAGLKRIAAVPGYRAFLQVHDRVAAGRVSLQGESSSVRRGRDRTQPRGSSPLPPPRGTGQSKSDPMLARAHLATERELGGISEPGPSSATSTAAHAPTSRTWVVTAPLACRSALSVEKSTSKPLIRRTAQSGGARRRSGIRIPSSRSSNGGLRA